MHPDDRLRQLQADDRVGTDIPVVAFWGHKPSPDGKVGPGCLSQWWPAPFTVDGVAYPTAEHWMMAGKARLFDDPAGLAAVLAATHPGAAKKAGRLVTGFDEARWVAARYDLVVAGNLAKFGQHPDLAGYLLATGERVLVEASPFDRIWGIGVGPNHPSVPHPAAWRGSNLLGFALMAVRTQLRAGQRGAR